MQRAGTGCDARGDRVGTKRGSREKRVSVRYNRLQLVYSRVQQPLVMHGDLGCTRWSTSVDARTSNIVGFRRGERESGNPARRMQGSGIGFARKSANRRMPRLDAISGDSRVIVGTPRVHAHVPARMRAVRARIIRAMCVQCNGYSPKASLSCLPSYCLFLPPR